MADLQFIGAVEKLNNQNYSMWQTCMESYFQGLDLWEIVGGSDITPPPAANAEALRKWRIKAGKVMFAIKTTVEKEMLEYIRYASTPKEAWDILPARIREKENEMRRLQLLESEHMSRDTTKYVSLHRALVKGDLESVKAFLAQDENAISVPISLRGERPIHIAVAEGHVQLVEELVKMINPVFLEFRQDDGETALHIAARGADTRIAKALVEAYGELVRLENRNHHLPVTLAAIFGNTEMFNYLRSVTSQQDLIPRIVNIPRSYFDQQNYRI
ncbi:ankyrin repeat-containing protein NPR4-like [Cornus florida]|uniref:ankyrin repeat-containing protein NPR4-like n=1 Tax=Cornus florida TaxID=4283 RepID=UPI00289651E2|nr:ankyrin repeat-containing protein NPR4-like [Cornus florida]